MRESQRTDWAGASSNSGASVSQKDWAQVAACACHSGSPLKSLEEHVATQSQFLRDNLTPALEAGQQGNGHVFFVDTAHFMYRTFLC
jgi:hypothetical protein